MAITKVTSRVLEDSSVGVAQLSAGAVPTKLGSEIGPFAFRNKIINGNMIISQRNGETATTQPLGSNAYSLDRWGSYQTGSTVTHQKLDTTLTGQGNLLRVTGNTGNTLFQVYQKIEGVNTRRSIDQFTLSFWAASSNLTNINVVVNYNSSGTTNLWNSNSYAAESFVLDRDINITSTMTRYSVTFNGNINMFRGIQVTFGNRALGAGQTFDITGVQLEEGSFATPFEQRPIGTELALCQRYYETGRDYTSRFGSDGYTNEFFVSFKATKRATPNMTFPYKTGQYQDPGPVNTGVTGSNVYYQYLGAAYLEGFYMIWDPVFPNQDAAPQLDYTANAEL